MAETEGITEVFSPPQEDFNQAQKSSAHAEKTSADSQNLPTLDGSKVGRKFTHTDARINEILDHYLLTGELPEYVTERQKRSYRSHVRLSERRERLEKRGRILFLSNGRNLSVKLASAEDFFAFISGAVNAINIPSWSIFMRWNAVHVGLEAGKLVMSQEGKSYMLAIAEPKNAEDFSADKSASQAS